MKTIAVCGVSGVGKTWLLSRLSDATGFAHVSASSLLVAGRRLEGLDRVGHDELSTLSIDRNQFHIGLGYRDFRSGYVDALLLDCHVIIDAVDGIERINAATFQVLDVVAFVHLSARPELIYGRRETDTARSRPRRSATEIAVLQRESECWATELADQLGAPLISIQVEEPLDEIARTVKELV